MIQLGLAAARALNPSSDPQHSSLVLFKERKLLS
jgi:hypothetical protein